MDINAAVSYLEAFLTSNQTSAQDRAAVTSWMLNRAASERGYNNYQSSERSGETFFLNQFLAPMQPRLCIDIGANVGSYSRALLTCTSAQVHCFEPVSLSFQQLQELTKEYPDRLLIHRMGIGDHDGTMPIYFNSDALSHASLLSEMNKIEYVSNTQTEEVQICKLDTFFKESLTPIDFIKIDTEGFEKEVLDGSRGIIEAHKPKAIQIEFNHHQLFRGQTIYSFSQILPDYKVFQLLPSAILERDPGDPFANLFLFSNFVFIRHDYIEAGNSAGT